jgi:hypothetical protein
MHRDNFAFFAFIAFTLCQVEKVEMGLICSMHRSALKEMHTDLIDISQLGYEMQVRG